MVFLYQTFLKTGILLMLINMLFISFSLEWSFKAY